MARPLVIFLSGAGWEARYQAATLAVTAAALGDPVTVALAFEPLRLWAGGRFDEGAPGTAAAARVASLRDTLEEARRELGLRLVACETAVRLAGLDPAAVRALVDQVTTLPALWREARDGQLVFA
jgi:peroxiredoxin family protein